MTVNGRIERINKLRSINVDNLSGIYHTINFVIKSFKKLSFFYFLRSSGTLLINSPLNETFERRSCVQ